MRKKRKTTNHTHCQEKAYHAFIMVAKTRSIYNPAEKSRNIKGMKSELFPYRAVPRQRSNLAFSLSSSILSSMLNCNGQQAKICEDDFCQARRRTKLGCRLARTTTQHDGNQIAKIV